jgi:hypothetical protein
MGPSCAEPKLRLRTTANELSPGTSTCSPEQICSRNWRFVDPGFQPDYQLDNSFIAALTLFVSLTIVSLVPVFMAILPCIYRAKSPQLSPLKVLQSADIGPVAVLSMISIFEIIVCRILVAEVVRRMDIKSDAAVNFDWECQAIHVALSPWRFYLDVKYDKGLRIAKIWFNS